MPEGMHQLQNVVLVDLLPPLIIGAPDVLIGSPPSKQLLCADVVDSLLIVGLSVILVAVATCM